METIHKFEKAGLGKAPFHASGVSEKVYVSHPGAVPQAGGTCDYCGMGIRYCCHVQSSDGKEFVVGLDCAQKIGDEGLRTYATTEQEKLKREVARKRRMVKSQQSLERILELLADPRVQEVLSSQMHSRGFRDRQSGQPLTRLHEYQWYADNAGHTGRLTIIKQIEKAMGGK